MSRLEDLGAEIAAWVLVPNNHKSSLIHHMGSQRGREFIKSKPDINAQLHVFLQNSKKKGKSCFFSLLNLQFKRPGFKLIF